MPLTIDGTHLALLAGAVQGFLLAAALAAHRTNRTANRLLAALMLAFTVSLVSEVYYAAGLVRQHPHFFGVSYPLPWAFGPLVYLYALAASDRGWRLDARAARHLAPVLAVVLLTLPIYLRSGAEKVALFERLRAGDVPTVLVLLEPFKYVSGLAYSAATVLSLRAHRRRVEDSYANTERVNLRWLQWLAGAAALVWLLATATATAGVLPAWMTRDGDALVSLAVTVVVYAIGYRGLRQPEIFRWDPPPAATAAQETVPVATATAATTATTAAIDEAAPRPPIAHADRGDARYERSGLDALERRRLEQALVQLMETAHPYRDPELTLPALAARLGSTPHRLSEVLNRERSQTFYDFVNGYRVDEVRRRLADPAARHLSILALALDAGFASKSTFNQAFKRATGQTPSSYRSALEPGPALADAWRAS